MSTPNAGTNPVILETDVTFESGTERLNALLARPDLAEAVAVRREELRQADRQHAIGLAMIRQAANLTQTELAEALGVGQAAVAKIERRQDLLLSTLRAYLAAAGGHARLVVDFDDGARSVELDLETLGQRPDLTPRATPETTD
jgi:DNA-binding XRE family transcriptional regulator